MFVVNLVIDYLSSTPIGIRVGAQAILYIDFKTIFYVDFKAIVLYIDFQTQNFEIARLRGNPIKEI